MRILHLDTVDSTNTYVLRHFSVVADNVLVSAFEQTSGRGRQGRKWIAPPGRNLTVSFGMTRIADGFHAGAVAGLAVLDLVRESVPGCSPYLKWPNDVYVGAAKLAGILCEGILEHGKLSGIVAGIGLNVNLGAAEIGAIDQRATSLKILAPELDFSVADMAERLAFFLERWYINYDCDRRSVLAAWRRENRLVGRMIEVVDPLGNVLSGRFSAIDGDGSMILETPDGDRVFRCGDVKVASGFEPEKSNRPGRALHRKRKNLI
jgi:BirA family biotin operon repressor/biotin-[acetyl-CoA-carboxylase] ligase